MESYIRNVIIYLIFMKYFLVTTSTWLFISLAISSCSSKNSSQPNNKPINFGQITHKVCKADTSQSYEVYLPAYYSAQKKWPVIYVFDSHGDGKLAVIDLRDAAERFGYIIVGSDNSKNGLQTLDHTLEILLKDVTRELSIDLTRQYAAGFSGGGRVASYLASKTGNLKGIITCGAGIAGFDPRSVVSKFDIYAIAGREDFNYDEVMAINQQLSNTDWRFITMAFDGGHGWPPYFYMTQAVLWFQLNAMRDGLIPKDNDIPEQELDSTAIRCSQFLASRQFIRAADECKRGIAFVKDLASTKKLYKKLRQIQSEDEYMNELRETEQRKYTEQKLREGYIQAFTSNDTSWWRNEIGGLHTKTKQENNLATSQMLKRMQGFLGIVCYSFTSRAIAGNNLDLARKYIAIYEMAEPENPDCFFYKALVLDRSNHQAAALEFKKAIKFGFKDFGKAKTSLSKEALQLAGL
jgi:dienelactone hydrolase